MNMYVYKKTEGNGSNISRDMMEPAYLNRI
jgi:hypothetical protein